MADKHPRDMTRAELSGLPTVSRLRQVVLTFTGAGGTRWSVGRSGEVWVKAYAGPPQERP